MTPVRLEPAALRSRVKHSTTEPLRSPLVDGCGGKSNSFKLLWKSLLPTNEEIHSKMKVLEWSQQISHCKSMQIFYDAQGKFTPQSKVGSTLN